VKASRIKVNPRALGSEQGTTVPGLAEGEKLQRALSLRHFIAIGINVGIGGSIYLIGADVYRLAGNWSLAIAGAVGIFSIIMALVMAEVSSRFDCTGGAYVQTRTAFGAFWGFQVAWMLWFTRVTAQASLTNGIVTSIAYFSGGTVSDGARIACLTAATVGITLLHLRRVEQSARIILAFAVFKLLPLAAVLGAAAWLGVMRAVHFGSAPSALDSATAALLLIFSFSGYEIIPVSAGEGRNPRRDVPVATVASVAIVVCVWMLLHLTLINTVPNLASEPRPVAASAAILMGAGMGVFVNLGAIVSALGTCIAVHLAASRCLYATAVDRLVPSWFAAVHPVQRVPQNAILFSAAVVLVFSISGSFAFLAEGSAIPRLFIFFSVAAALIRFREFPAVHGAVRAPSFSLPFGSALAATAMVACVVVLAGVSLRQLAFGVGGFLVGAILYLGNARRRASAARAVASETRSEGP
jgi:APA family basic amino acid/polyamine antiporter